MFALLSRFLNGECEDVRPTRGLEDARGTESRKDGAGGRGGDNTTASEVCARGRGGVEVAAWRGEGRRGTLDGEGVLPYNERTSKSDRGDDPVDAGALSGLGWVRGEGKNVDGLGGSTAGLVKRGEEKVAPGELVSHGDSPLGLRKPVGRKGFLRPARLKALGRRDWSIFGGAKAKLLKSGAALCAGATGCVNTLGDASGEC